ncbi:proline-rich protein HaeIII subfamily 1-like [Vidua macroura]|uniref:proline-rich protein HaeIII subfamily 1-like n=1 Tax=Vidua macroura TaxID=187451 RepID=UPI0023A8EA8D|nr:proline-rich protein HaeIII subfamily 1-like [Vidua macroura]
MPPLPRRRPQPRPVGRRLADTERRRERSAPRRQQRAPVRSRPRSAPGMRSPPPPRSPEGTAPPWAEQRPPTPLPCPNPRGLPPAAPPPNEGSWIAAGGRSRSGAGAGAESGLRPVRDPGPRRGSVLLQPLIRHLLGFTQQL